MRHFLKIDGKGFRIGKEISGLHSGIVVASPDAFYFVVGPRGIDMGLAGAGGAGPPLRR